MRNVAARQCATRFSTQESSRHGVPDVLLERNRTGPELVGAACLTPGVQYRFDRLPFVDQETVSFLLTFLAEVGDER